MTSFLGVELVEATFGILGRTALSINDAMQETWGKPRERAVLGALLVHAGRWVPVDTLIEWAWPEEKAQPRNIGPTFHTYAARVRKVLRQLPSSPSLDGGGGSYRLDVDRSHVDYYRFTALLREARAYLKQQNSRQAAESARRALDLWRGRPLDDLAGEPARAWRLRVVQDDWLGANRTLLAALLELDEFDEVLTRVGELQTDHPGDAILATQRMSALHGLGRYEDETAYYLTVRRKLQHDGDEPAMAHVRQHHERLRTSDHGGSHPAPHINHVIVPRQLRHDVADFVGRADLVAELDAAVTDREGLVASGVVLIDGMAGVGKTALVTHWGHRARQHFPEGDLYVDLNGFAENTAVSHAAVVDDFLIALGHPPDAELTGRARELLLTRLLSGRRMLVVLDNARDAKHVEQLVRLLPDALVLVTSRQQLVSLSATTSARRVQVEPMTPTTASTLLAMRLGTRREMTRDAIARLAALCGGLPLMISLLAEHIATRPAGQMPAFAEQVDERQLVVDVGEDGDTVTAQTFFTWSYRALAPAEQRLFRLLGLHPGTHFSIHAAGALDGRTRAETTHSIRALVGAHLVERAATELDRYQLHDLVREFAAHCAESDESAPERQSATRRLASFYLASTVHANHTLYPSRLSASELAVEQSVEPVVPADTAQAKTWFDMERLNLLAMIRIAADAGHHAHAWRLTDAAVIFFDRHGYYEESLAVQKIATTSARKVGDQVGEASSLAGLGRVCLTVGQHKQARQHLDAALHIVEDIGHQAGQVAVLGLLGKLETQRGDLAAALALYRRGLKIAQKNDDSQGLCWTSYRVGMALRAVEQHDEALVHLTRAQILAEHSGDQSAYACALIEIGRAHHDRGDHSAAVAHCEQGLRAAEAIPDLAVSLDACIALAEINKARGHVGTAIEFARRAIRMSSYSTAAHAHDVLGDVHYANADTTAAAAAWQEAAEHYDQLGNLPQAAAVHAKLARIPHTDVVLPQARSASPRSNINAPAGTTAHHNDQQPR